MPETDGRELLRQVRRSLLTQDLPVIVISASSKPGDEIELLEAGADDYLQKPVAVDRVEARVRAVLSGAASISPEARAGPRLSGTCY